MRTIPYAPLAQTTGTVDNSGAPWGDPNCQVCHGEVENNYDPWVAEESTRAQTSTLRNIVKFRNLYALQAMKVEREHQGTTPTIDLGNASPAHPATDYFFTHVRSNAPYFETYSWTAFFDGPKTIPADRMTVQVTDLATPGITPATQTMSNPGRHPDPAATAIPGPASPADHPATASDWERVDLTISPNWIPDLPGNYQGTLDIVITQL